jgi:hypothetical protein
MTATGISVSPETRIQLCDGAVALPWKMAQAAAKLLLPKSNRHITAMIAGYFVPVRRARKLYLRRPCFPLIAAFATLQAAQSLLFGRTGSRPQVIDQDWVMVVDGHFLGAESIFQPVLPELSGGRIERVEHCQPYGRDRRVGPVDPVVLVRCDLQPIAGPEKASFGLVGEV